MTLYRACLKTRRTLVVDLYTAEVLETLASFGRLPQSDWPNMKVVVTSAFARMYRKKGEAAFVERMVPFGISARALAGTPDRWVAMVCGSLLRDYKHAGVTPDAGDAWFWSMWRGFLDRPDGTRLREWFTAGGARTAHLHTSGHASPHDLRASPKAWRRNGWFPSTASPGATTVMAFHRSAG